MTLPASESSCDDALVIAAVAGCLAVSPGADQIVAARHASGLAGDCRRRSRDAVAFAPAPGVARLFGHRTCGGWRRVFIWIVCPNPHLFRTAWSRLSSPSTCWPPCRGSFRARIEILEASRAAVPEGEPEFPLAGFATFGRRRNVDASSVTPAIALLHLGQGEVRVSASLVVAGKISRPASRFATGQVRVETRDEFPAAAGCVHRRRRGRVLRRAVSAGTALRSEWLDTVKDVTRGETVKVEVHSGNGAPRVRSAGRSLGVAGQTFPW